MNPLAKSAPLSQQDRYYEVVGHPAIAEQFLADDVTVKDLFVDYSYARPLTPHRVRKLEKQTYDNRKVGMIYVCMRNDDGSFAVIDGQGRMFLARKDGVSTIPARVYMDLTVQQEAELYLAFNRDRDETTAVDDYQARLVAQEPDALGIQAIMDELGIVVRRGQNKINNKPTLQAIAACNNTYTNWGPTVLRNTLRTLLKIWPGVPSALTSDMVYGMTAFSVRIALLEKQSGTKFDYAQFVARGQAKPVHIVKGMARSQSEVRPGMGADQAIGRALLAIYDTGRRNKLGEWPEYIYTDAGRAAHVTAVSRTNKARVEKAR